MYFRFADVKQGLSFCGHSSVYTCMHIYVTVMVPSTTATATVGAAAVVESVKPEPEVVVSRRDDTDVFPPPITTTMLSAVHTGPAPTTTLPHRAMVDALFPTHLPAPASSSDRRSRPSPPPPALASRPMSHTAPARPLARPEPELAAAAAAAHTDLDSLPVGFEMTTACPICQTPIPFDATSSDAFARHVDECISRVTREGPSSAASSQQAVSTDRTCPVCNMSCPTDRFSQTDFERHVNDHFDDGASQFVPLV